MMSGYFGMYGGGGLIWLLIVGALVIIPFWRLLPQYRIPSWVAIFAIIPLVALILLWVMAFKEKLDGGSA